VVIHSDKLRWLFWLRWKLFLRGFARDKTRIITTIILLVFGIPLYGSIAVVTFLGYRFLDYPANAELLFLVLTGVYLFWMALPLLEFTANEGLDVSKLMLFPLTRLELMVSLLFSTLLDIPMFGLILVFIAVVAGWAFSLPVALFALVAILIFYAQVVGISQLVLAFLMRTLQSRRFRDLSIILVALISSSCYIVQQILFRSIGNGGNITESLAHASFSTYLQWFPPGMAARAIQQAYLGNWGASLLWLVVSLGACILVLYLWTVVLERGLSTPEVGGAVRARRPRRARSGEAQALPQAQTTNPGFWQRIGSTQTIAITVKDLIYFWRDPQLKAVLLSSLYIVIVLVIGPLFNSRNSSTAWLTLTFGAPLAAFFAMLTLSYNSLGLERQSLTTLFLFPVPPRRILFGKNLAVAMLGAIELVILELLSAFLAHDWNIMWPTLIVGLAGIGIVLGCGNITSIFLPQRMRQIQRGLMASGSSAGNAGCTRSLITMFMLLLTMVLLVPVALALLLPLFFHIQWVWVFSIPAALIYAAAFYLIVTSLVAPHMLSRAPEILAVTTRE
jgi:ABC-2 type transport system permease protein